jgi:sporulation protein YlmC with PRC-barrel domain
MAPMAHAGQWRASKLVGLNVYSDRNEKLGDINEILLDQSGTVAGVVIGVGGFLGMGERAIMVSMNKLKFVNEPVHTSATTTTRSTTTGSAARPATTGERTTTTTTVRAKDEKWYPDHAVLSGVTKDQLKNMTEFRYN